MVDYIKMTEQASELLKAPQTTDDTPPSSSLDDKLKKEALDLAAAQQRKEEQPKQKKGMGCIAKGCLVVLILNALFAALCIALGLKEYNKSDAAEQEPAATATP